MSKENDSWYNLIVDRNGDGALDVYIYDEIGMWGTSAEDFVKDVGGELEKDQELRVHLNSPGGSVFDGLAIYNFLTTRNKVTTIVDGVAASMASVIFMAGSNRIMPENALLMIHNPWAARIGDAEELRKAAEALDTMKDSIVGIYAKVTGKDTDEVKVMLDDETWMNGKDAIENGFATMLTDEVKMAASFDIAKLNVIPDALAKAREMKEKEMSEVKEIQAKLDEATAKLESQEKDYEAKAKESFDSGVDAGKEEALGKVKSRMDRYKDAAFVIETIDLDDSEVMAKYVEILEADNKKKAEALDALNKDDGEEAVPSKAAGNEPETVVKVSVAQAREARAAELKAEGKSAEEAYRMAYSEIEDKEGE